MRIVTWAIRLVLFVLLVAFAAKNVEPVTLRFYFDLALQAPLIVMLFAFFAAGALFGVAGAARHRCCASGARSRSCEDACRRSEPGRPPLADLC